MPKKLDRCVEKLIKEGYTKEQAWAICKSRIQASLQKEYELKKKILTGQLLAHLKEETKGEHRED